MTRFVGWKSHENLQKEKNHCCVESHFEFTHYCVSLTPFFIDCLVEGHSERRFNEEKKKTWSKKVCSVSSAFNRLFPGLHGHRKVSGQLLNAPYHTTQLTDLVFFSIQLPQDEWSYPDNTFCKDINQSLKKDFDNSFSKFFSSMSVLVIRCFFVNINIFLFVKQFKTDCDGNNFV